LFEKLKHSLRLAPISTSQQVAKKFSPLAERKERKKGREKQRNNRAKIEKRRKIYRKGERKKGKERKDKEDISRMED
jgi:hypothetical protein